MYTVFVPLTEFLQNGGALKRNRDLYQYSTSAGVSGSPICIGPFIERLSITRIKYLSALGSSISTNASMLYVKVPCNPIYE